MEIIKSAVARWDTDSNKENPGWVIDITRMNGDTDTIAPAPGVYHEPRHANTAHIVEVTLRYEGMEV